MLRKREKRTIDELLNVNYKKMSHRLEQINKLIQKELSQALRKELELPPAVLLTVTRVRTGADLKNARVFLTVLPEEKKDAAMNLLVKNRVLLQSELAKNLKTKFSPRLEFVYDETAAQADRIERILDEISDSG